MKTLFKLLLIVVLAGYLIYAFIRTTGKEDPTVCTGVQVTFTDTLHSGFITVDEVCRLLKTAQLDPVGLLMDSVDGQKIIKTLEANSFIKSVECYKSPNGIVNLNVTQRLPILRVMPEGRDAYYIDEDGLKMVERQYNANLVVASGYIDTAFVRQHLLEMAKYLRANPFWDDLVTQIYVRPDRKMDLYTRVAGDMVIHFGTSDSIARKFEHLRAFYEKVIPNVGWSTYKSVSVEFYNQVVAERDPRFVTPEKKLPVLAPPADSTAQHTATGSANSATGTPAAPAKTAATPAAPAKAAAKPAAPAAAGN